MGVIVAGDDVRSAPVALVGGKARGLARLVEVGAPVPPFFVVTTEGEADVADALEALGPGPYAVRSSAVVEDGATASWAGQFTSVLGVDAGGVAQAIRTCRASAEGERARAYAATHGVVTGPMAVVVQRMIVGQASGVAFSRTPEDPDRALISVGLGLGEGVVAGRVPCDTFRVDRTGGIEASVADKDEETALVGGEVVTRPVEGARRVDPALGDEGVRQVARWAFRLEEALGIPVDVEFTVADGQLWLVQVRPITVAIPRGRRLLWDNSNIVESYSGITTPLTFTFASAVYTIVYQLFCRVMGVDAATIRANEPVFKRMIGLVRGRVYYNLNSWYRVLSLLPGFQFNRGAMETMMGVSEVASDEDAGATGPRWAEGLKLGWLGARLGWRLLRLESDAAAFQRTFDATLAHTRSLDLDRMGADELLGAYELVEQKLLWGWTPPLVNDFFCMIFYKVLERRCRDLTGDAATQLHNRLVAGEGTLASAAPATDLLGLARFSGGVDALRAPLTSARPDALVLAECLGHDGFRQQWDRWMTLYGDRSPDELKLESPTLRDTPEFTFATLRAWVRDGARVREFGADAADRAAAEAEVARLLAKENAVRRALFGFILRQARRRIGMREALRFERTRIFGFVRRLFRAFGDRYVAGGHLDSRDDVFFLALDEVLGFARGTTPTTDLRGLVSLRRAEFERFRAAESPAERFHTWGAVHVGNAFAGKPIAAVAAGDDEIAGTPCSPGRVVAVARVVRDPRDVPDLKGAILCAHRTDPGWVPLFPTASAVIVERGSLLSHSAVVARELGLPAVVGVRGFLDWVQDGETIGMDGSTGRIWRVRDGAGE